MSSTSPCGRRTRGTHGRTRARSLGGTSTASRSGRPSRSAALSPRSGGRSRSRCDAGSASTSGTTRACSRGRRIRGTRRGPPRSFRSRSARGPGGGGPLRSPCGHPRGSPSGPRELDRRATGSGRPSSARGREPRALPRPTSTAATTSQAGTVSRTAGGREPKVLRWLSRRDNHERALKAARGASSPVRRKCFVCGFRSARPVCPRCHTILRPEQAVCATCGKGFEGWIAACDACGAPMKLANATLADREAVRSLASIPGMSDERAKELAAKGFRDLADVVRNEILQAFGGVTRDDLLREEYAHQIEAWRTKGFDVAHVEHLLEADLPNFRKRSARLIRLQVAKKADSGRYRCPLCEVRLESIAEE